MLHKTNNKDTLIILKIDKNRPKSYTRRGLSLPVQSRKKLAHDIFSASATHNSLVHNVADSDTDCGAQNAELMVVILQLSNGDFKKGKTTDFATFKWRL